MSKYCTKKAMSKLVAVCIGVSALAGFSSGTVSADTGMDSNLFNNGSFEAPVYEAGTQITDTEHNVNTVSYGQGTVTVVGTNATQGNKSLELAAKSAVNQLVTLEAGKQYVFSADLYAPNTSRFDLSRYKPSGFDGSDNTGDFTGSKKMLYKLTPTETGNYRLKMANVGSTTMYLDNVRVTEIKEGVVYDGSFEDALTGTHNSLKNIGWNDGGTVVTDKAKDGVKSLQIGNATYNAYIPVEPNTTYNFTAYAYVASGKTATIGEEQYLYDASGSTMNSYKNLTNDVKVSITGNDNWNKISISVTTGASDKLLRYKLTFANVDYIDNLCLTKVVKEPGVFKNGGFEAPAYDLGEYVESTRNFDTVDTQGIAAEIVELPRSEGEQALKLIGSGSPANQMVPLEANSKYTLKLDAYLSDPGVFNCDVYNAAGNALINGGHNTISNIGSGKFVTLSYEFETTEAYDARFKMYSNAATTYIDNIRLEKYVPEVIDAGIFYNGDFENYDLGAYTETDYTFKKFGIQAVETEIVEKGDANKALKMTAAEKAIIDDTAAFNQKAKLEEGKIYKLSMKAAVDENSKNAVKLCVVALADETHEGNDWFFNNVYTEEVTSTDFVTVTKIFKAPRDCDARFKVSVAEAGTIYLDNITLTEVTLGDTDFDFDYGTPSVLTSGNEYRVYYPEGTVIVAMYNDKGALVDVNFENADVKFKPSADAVSVKIFAFDSFETIQPLRSSLTIPVQKVAE